MQTVISPKILFLCTGNYYRSRFAEHLFNALAIQEDLKWRAESRGLAIEYGTRNVGALSLYARAGLIKHGIVISSEERFPIQATEVDFRTADKIIALDESEHRPLMAQRFPQWATQIEYWQVHDLDQTSYSLALPQIEQHLQQLIESLRDGKSW